MIANIGSVESNTYNNVQPDLSVPDNPGDAGETGNVGSTRVGGQGTDAISSENVARMRDQPRIDGRAAMKGAKVRELSHLVARRSSVGKSIGNFFRFFARNIAKACHAIRGCFTYVPPKRSREEFQDSLEVRHEEDYASPSRVGTLQRGQGIGTAFSCTMEELGASMGLRGSVYAKPFTKDEVDSIRAGRFAVTDIKQDPNFADCWFLGSLASFITAKGPAAIQELITLPPPGEMNDPDPSNPPKALVKLGGETYAVPLAELHDRMGSGVSTSAPWVKLLETAMQMYLVKMHENKVIVGGLADKVDMAFGDARVALHALMGKGITRTQHENKRTHQMVDDPPAVDTSGSVQVLGYNSVEEDSMKSIVESVMEALKNKRPVVLASSASLLTALGAGISPNHCVSVQEIVVVKKNNDDPVTNDTTVYFQVFDPYNRAVSISADILKDADTHIYLERPPAENS